VSQTFDVIVVGAGTAGVPAAVAAAERGLRVALVEAAQDIGGTLVLSGGSISAAGTPMQKAAGVEDSTDAHFADALRINHGTGDHVLLRAWIDRAADTIDWLLDKGWTCTPFEPVFAPEHDLYTTPRTYRSTQQGFSLIHAYRNALTQLADRGNLTLFLGTRVREVIVADGVATGVIAKRGEEKLRLDARHSHHWRLQRQRGSLAEDPWHHPATLSYRHGGWRRHRSGDGGGRRHLVSRYVAPLLRRYAQSGGAGIGMDEYRH
jgi:fumarate reductase flavoprotein subunit